ncbi:MAG: hypothetical protein AWU57_1515 [Marinobacter sp. T13-3]|nr:MAG: hypothetical protein AWU57_1515 [Marinobacter sp. T13-3]
MTKNANTPLTEDQIETIAQKASLHAARAQKVDCVIQEITANVAGDDNHKASCAIHVLNGQLQIGPHQDVLDQLGKAFPNR